MAPAPRSKPSNNTYTMIIIAIRQNQRVPMLRSSARGRGYRRLAMRNIFRVGSVLDFTINEEEPQDTQHRVQPHKPNQRKPGISERHLRRHTVSSTHQPINEPRL